MKLRRKELCHFWGPLGTIETETATCMHQSAQVLTSNLKVSRRQCLLPTRTLGTGYTQYLHCKTVGFQHFTSLISRKCVRRGLSSVIKYVKPDGLRVGLGGR